jgi:hypothetical protein
MKIILEHPFQVKKLNCFIVSILHFALAAVLGGNLTC